jgi:hypothetical protein
MPTESHFTTALLDVVTSASLIETSLPHVPTPVIESSAFSILDANQNASIRILNTQKGLLPEYFSLTGFLYIATLFMEKMGPGADPPIIKSVPVPIIQGPANGTTTGVVYPPLDIALPAGLITDSMYKVTVSYNLYNAARTWSPWHSFIEIGMIQYGHE